MAGEASWAYDVDVLVSDGSVPADFTDPHLKNPWGVAFNPFGFDWVAHNHTGTSTLYDGRGKANTLVVTIPGVNGEEVGEPTGIVYSGGTDFVVSDGTREGPARFLFAGEDGTITGWAPDVNLNQAIVAVDRSEQQAVYMGLAIGGKGVGHRLYATNPRSRRSVQWRVQAPRVSRCLRRPATAIRLRAVRDTECWRRHRRDVRQVTAG